MNTIELSAALGQAQVVENLKNFVGVDAQGAAALMTPERLAAVAGGFTCGLTERFMGSATEFRTFQNNRMVHILNGKENGFPVDVAYIMRIEYVIFAFENTGSAIYYQVNWDGWSDWKMIQATSAINIPLHLKSGEY